MKHVNEPMPDVQVKRPEVSAALAAVVERATAKDPKTRYRTWPAASRTSRRRWRSRVARAGGSHGEATTVLDTVPKKRRKILTTRRVSAAGGLHRARGDRGRPADHRADRQEGEPRARAGSHGRADCDYQHAVLRPAAGDGQENDDQLKLAIDGNPGTGWTTETYQAPTTQAAVGKRASD